MAVSALVNRVFSLGLVASALIFATGCAGFVSGQFLTPSSRLRFFAADSDFEKMVEKDPFPRAEQVGLKPLAANQTR